MKSLRQSILAAALAAAGPALAQQHTPFYIGGGAGVGSLNASGQDLTGLNNAQLDDTDTTYTLRMGWRFNPWLALELGYYDFGKYAFSGRAVGTTADITGSAKAKSYGISLVGNLPIDRWDLYARIGYAHSELKLNANAPLVATPYNEKDTQDEATYGVGARWNLARNWGLFAEWARNDKIKVDSYLFGADLKF